MYIHFLTLCIYIFNLIYLDMSILSSNFAVEIRTTYKLNGGETNETDTQPHSRQLAR